MRNKKIPDFKKTALGIEFGSTRIKAVLTDEKHDPIAYGEYEWESTLHNGVWTYSLDEVKTGLQACFAMIKNNIRRDTGTVLSEVGAVCISGMMHGYLPLDKNGSLLVPFRTWQNTITGEASEKLTELFGFNIPQRWCIAHLYQAIINGEEHIWEISSITTLAGYVHFCLTGEKVVGIGDASGIFPIDSKTCDYDENMVVKFNSLLAANGLSYTLRDILPRVACAGKCAGYLTRAGAEFIDPEGVLKPGIPFCPCEGDAGTGMTATNSVRVATGNVSAGTSAFAMVVTDKPLGVHREIDMVTTPDGKPVAMVHCNNCTGDINAWIDIFAEFSDMIGAEKTKSELFALLFEKASEGDADCGGLLSYNCFCGEGITGLNSGRPLFARSLQSNFNLANFMRTHIVSALATHKLGLDILKNTERVKIDCLHAHGGYFKTPEVGQRIMSAAAGVPISVMSTAGEGGAYGGALLASYML